MKKFLFFILCVPIVAYSQIQPVNVGTSANDRTGDPLREAFQKLNSNDRYLDSLIINGSGQQVDLTVDNDGTEEIKVEAASSITANPDNKSQLLIGNLDDGLGSFIPTFRLGAYRNSTAFSVLSASDENFKIMSTDGSNTNTFNFNPTGYSFNKPLSFSGTNFSAGNSINIPTAQADAFRIQGTNGVTFMKWDMSTNAEVITFGKTSALANRQLVLKYTHQPSLAGTRFDDLSIPTKKYVDDNAVAGGNGMTKSGSSLNLGGTVNSDITLTPGTTGTGVFQIGDLFGNKFDRFYFSGKRAHFYLGNAISDNEDVFYVEGNNGMLVGLDRNTTVGIDANATSMLFTDLQSNQFTFSLDEANRKISTWVSDGGSATTQFIQTTSGFTLDGETTLTDIPANDNTLTQILARDGTTGKIKYRTAASLSGGGGVTAGAGLTLTGSTLDLGGDLNGLYTINTVTGPGSRGLRFTYGGNIDANRKLQIGEFVTAFTPIDYTSDLSAGFTDFSLINKQYADNRYWGGISLSSVSSSTEIRTVSSGSINFTNAGSGSNNFTIGVGDGFDTFEYNLVQIDGAGVSAKWGDSGNVGVFGLSANNGINFSTSGTFNINGSEIATKSYADSKIQDNITNGDLTAPTENAVFDALALKADLASPTFTGTVVLPSTTSIGNVSSTELGFIDGVTSSVQTQLGTKVQTASNGLTKSGVDVSLGGTLTGSTSINLSSGLSEEFSIFAGSSSRGWMKFINGASSVTQPTFQVKTGTGNQFTMDPFNNLGGGAGFFIETADGLGLQYVDDISGTLGDLSLIHKGFADITYVPLTRTVNGHSLSANVSVTKGDVELSNVDNTSDANKPVSTAQQTALNLKANLTSNTFTGKQTLTTDATNAGLNVGAFAGDPSSVSTGDFWFNSTDGAFKGRYAVQNETFVHTSGGLASAFSLLYASNATTGQVASDADMTYNAVTNSLTVPRIILSPTATRPGLSLGSLAGDPSSLADGDMWYNSSSNELKARINGSSVALGAGGGVSDGDKGDITVSGSGSTYTVDNDVVTYAKMQNVSAASKLIGRGDSGSGDPQEITIGSGLTMTGTTLSATGGGGNDPRITTAVLASDHAISSTTGTEVALGATLDAGLYTYEYYIIGQSATATVGLNFGINFTGTSTLAQHTLTFPTTGTTTANGTADNSSGGITAQLSEAVTGSSFSTTTPLLTTLGVGAINSNILYRISGTILVTVSGDLELWHSSETATSTTVKANSSLIVTKVN